MINNNCSLCKNKINAQNFTCDCSGISCLYYEGEANQIYISTTKEINPKIAISSFGLGGLEAEFTSHFNKCQVFTIVEINQEKTEINKVEVIPNYHQETFYCFKPVTMLLERGVNQVIAGQIELNSFLELKAAGIQVLTGQGTFVKDIVKGYFTNKLSKILAEDICIWPFH